MKVLLESQTFVDGSAANSFFGLILETMMSGVDTPVRSPSAFSRFTLGGQDEPILSAAGTPWPQPGGQQPPGIPESYNIAIGSSPGLASNLGDPSPVQEDIQAQIASMLVAIQQLNEQLQKLAAKANPPQPQQQPQQQQQSQHQ